MIRTPLKLFLKESRTIQSRHFFWRKRKAPECCKEQEGPTPKEDYIVEKDCKLCLYDNWTPKVPALRPRVPTLKKKLGCVKRKHCYPGMPSEPITAEGCRVGGKCSAGSLPKIECMDSIKKHKEQISRAVTDVKVPLPDWDHHGKM